MICAIDFLDKTMVSYGLMLSLEFIVRREECGKEVVI